MPRSSMGICLRGTWRERLEYERDVPNAQVFNGDLSSWNVASVTDMSGMFSYAEGFQADICGAAWNYARTADNVLKDQMFTESSGRFLCCGAGSFYGTVSRACFPAQQEGTTIK